MLGFGHQGHFRKLGVPPLTRKKSSTLDGCSRYFKRAGFYSRVWSRMAETDMKEVLKPFHQRASEAEVRRKSICYKFFFFFFSQFFGFWEKIKKRKLKRWDSSSANFLSNQTARFLLIYVFMIIRCFRWLCSSKALRSGMWFYFFPKWGSVLFFEDKRISQFFAKCGNAHEMFVYILYPWREALRELLCFSFPIDSEVCLNWRTACQNSKLLFPVRKVSLEALCSIHYYLHRQI